MRPGQLTPNELELAILQRLARKVPGLEDVIPRLHVLSRKFSGVGSYTNFNPVETVAVASAPVGLHQPIVMPGLTNGLDAILFFDGNRVKSLEIATFGSEPWDGAYQGFSIPPVT
jgi:hypothetical protein